MKRLTKLGLCVAVAAAAFVGGDALVAAAVLVPHPFDLIDPEQDRRPAVIINDNGVNEGVKWCSSQRDDTVDDCIDGYTNYDDENDIFMLVAGNLTSEGGDRLNEGECGRYQAWNVNTLDATVEVRERCAEDEVVEIEDGQIAN